MKKPHDLLIYYGWLNSFNSGSHGWNNEKVAQELARYGILVLGDGIAASTHGDYANTKIILPRIKALNPYCKIYGYATVNQSYTDYKTKVDEWSHADIDVHGIFLDEAGYDYGKHRDEFNDRVDYAHSKEMKCMANAWKPEHVLSHDSSDDDASYLNSTYNADALESHLDADDWYLLESYAVDSSGNYESGSQWYDRGSKAREYVIQLAGSSVIADGSSGESAKFDYIYVSALMQRLDAVGSSDTLYGASSAKSKMYTRPDMAGLHDLVEDVDIALDGSKYMRYLHSSRLMLDTSANTSEMLVS